MLAVVLAVAAAGASSGSTVETIDFAITRDGKPIGRHTIQFSQSGDETIVDIAIDIEVRMMIFPVFTYEHRNREVWRDGRLIGLETTTNDNGEALFVRAWETADGLQVENNGGTFTAPAEILPTSYWHPQTARQSQMLDTQNGELVALTVRPLGSDAVDLEGSAVAARKYEVTGDLDLTVWYTPDGAWAKLMFAARGADIEYVPIGAWAAFLEGGA